MGGQPGDGSFGGGVGWEVIQGLVECAEDEEVVFVWGEEVWVVRTRVGQKRGWLLMLVVDKGRSCGCVLGGRRSWDPEVEGARVGRVGVVGSLEVSGRGVGFGDYEIEEKVERIHRRGDGGGARL